LPGDDVVVVTIVQSNNPRHGPRRQTIHVSLLHFDGVVDHPAGLLGEVPRRNPHTFS
jgi:hypothetical protein